MEPRNLIADGICTKECGQFSRNDTCHHLEFAASFSCNIRDPILDNGAFSKPSFSSGEEGTERMLILQMLKYARRN